MADTSKRDLRQEVTDQIIRALEQGTAPWQKPWQAGALEVPFNPVSGKPYRGGNVVQLMVVDSSHGYDDPRWLTYRQTQENGWQVRRGEKGTQVEFWQFPNGPGKREGNSKDDPGKSERETFTYRAYTIFNAKQIDGIPEHTPKVRAEWEVLQSAEAILRSSGARISHDQSDQAFYNRRTDTIHLPPRGAFKTATQFYGTALHELLHWTGAGNRLNRETLNEVLLQILVKLHEDRMSDQWVFATQRGKRLSHLLDRLKGICRRAGIREATLHSLRHSFGAHLRMAGVPGRYR